jgi:hypothetical protein
MGELQIVNPYLSMNGFQSARAVPARTPGFHVCSRDKRKIKHLERLFHCRIPKGGDIFSVHISTARANPA